MTSLDSFCLQREKKQNLRIPISRFDTESPYTTTGYTQFDLDMRRKAEILKYANNNSSTKTNNLTQQQLWVKFATNRNKLNVSKQTTSFFNRDINETYQIFHMIKNIDNNCPNTIINTSSSQSNVPGNINLYLDESVPLYNYKKETINYGILNEAYPYNILSNYESNKFNLNLSRTDIFQLYTLKPASNTTFVDINLPISLYINGVVKSDSARRNGNLNIQNNIITLTSLGSRSKFNNTILDELDVGYQQTVVNFDVSFNYDPYVNNTFTGIIYLQNITIGNINLNSTSDFVYDIDLMPTFSITQLTSLGDFDLNIGILTNVDISNNSVQQDCSFNSITYNNTPSNQVLNVYTPLKIDSYSDVAKQNKNIVQNIMSNSIVNQLAVAAPIVSIENTVRCLNQFVYFDYQQNSNAYNLKKTESISLQDISKNYYVFDAYYDANITYNLKTGTYYFVNVRKDTPIALSSTFDMSLNNNNPFTVDYGISYTKYTNEPYKYSYEGTDYLYGSIKMIVSGSFADVSLCTYKNGEKQDVNVTFTYNEYC